MAEGVVIDITTRVTGYEKTLSQLRDSLKQLDPGSAIARSIIKALQVAEGKLKSLGANLTPKITSNTQLDKLTEKVNTTGDAIQRVANLMASVGADDIDFSSYTNEIDNLITHLHELEAALDKKVAEEFRDSLSGVNLGFTIDPDSSPEVIFAQLEEKAKHAAAEVVKAQKAMEEADKKLADQQQRLTELQNNPVMNRAALSSQLDGVTHSYLEGLRNLREQMRQGLEKLLPGNKGNGKLLDGFFSELEADPKDLSNIILRLRQNITKTMGASAIKPMEIYDAIFGKKLSPMALGQYLTAHFSLDNLDGVKAQLTEALKKLPSGKDGLTEAQTSKIIQLIDKNDIEGALNTTLSVIDDVYSKIQAKIIQQQQRVKEALQGSNDAHIVLNAAEQAAQTATDNKDLANNEYERILNENAALREENETLRAEVEARRNAEAAQMHYRAKALEEEAAGFRIAGKEAEGYDEQLEKINQRKDLVGHIENIAKQWFSIYAAVRIAGQAIRSVVSTLAELDKTITNIAIVTDMTQSDLWAQMSAYTAMAQEYAVSISGVYEVSQLFYQQGLQTRDVMTLTGETLKMARIAGLDYAKATDYMTNALRSFKLENEEAARVTDVYSSLAASAAISVSELANAMSKTASSAYAVGSSIEATSAMITVMVEATRESSENIGSAMKSIISRYGEMTSDPTKLVDSEGEEMSLNRVDKALKTVGITLQDINGQFRNFDEVIMELASKWNTIDKNTQRYIATIMAFLYIKRRLVM